MRGLRIAIGIADRLAIGAGFAAVIALLMLIDSTTEKHERERNGFGGRPIY